MPKEVTDKTKERLEVKQGAKIFREVADQSRKYLFSNLHVFNPLLGHLLDLWFNHYR